MERATIYHYLRQIMMLPYLPANHIERAFEELYQRANTDQLRSLVIYMERQWMNPPIFDIPSPPGPCLVS
ncbi:hypothetical protein DPMN_003215 [Dreissena polymorpha]|uniref:Uncharacterized protein n=1 Tax=Dreissena polymorpha TaxID=45954 RepID=A0A9D4RUK5_DREPO|nr:hypothetical protein DPMN_003215 [Dreissena polymorpha]